MPRIIIARPSGAERLEVDQATFNEGFYPGFVYIADASGSPTNQLAPLAADMNTVLSDPTSAPWTTLKAALVPQASAAKSGFRDAALVTDGSYVRTQPLVGGNPLRILAKDPTRTGANGTGRLWGWRGNTSEIGYTDDDGATWHNVSTLPSSTSTYLPIQLEFSTNFLWLVQGIGNSQMGQLWRSPLPAADGTGITWTKVFDLSGMSSGPAGGASSSFAGTTFRNQSFAIQADESFAYLLDYASGSVTGAPGTATFSDGMIGLGSDLLYSPSGNAAFKAYLAATTFPVTIPGAGAAGGSLVTTIKEVLSAKIARIADPAQTAVTGATVTIGSGTLQSNIWGGPSLYTCPNPGAASAASLTWSRTSAWPYAKHGHAVKIIGGVPWVALGDVGWPSVGWGVYTGPQQLGLWAATTAAANVFNIKFGANGGYDAINFYPVNIAGTPCIVCESDDVKGVGPVAFPMQDPNAQNGAGVPLHRPPFPYIGTMRNLTFLPDGTMLYVLTGEQVGKQPLDAIVMSAAPYDTCVILDSAPVGTIYNTVLANGVYSNGYVWFGTWRVKVPAWKS